MRQRAFTGRNAVGVGAGGVAAIVVKETMKLALGMMETSGTRPAVRAGVDRLIAVLCFDTPQLLRHQLQRNIPTHFHKRLFAAPVAGCASVLEITEPDGRIFDPGFALHRAR